jgi:hypothetical protein
VALTTRDRPMIAWVTAASVVLLIAFSLSDYQDGCDWREDRSEPDHDRQHLDS